MSQRQATIGLIAGIVAPKYENHKRKHTPKDIQEDVKRDLGVDINYMKVWRLKERAIKMLRGGPTEGYIKMPSYLYMLDTVYPNSYIRMHKSTDNEFMYLFIALYPFIKGFEHCRPIVVVDGAHLKGAYKGTFVSASTLDGAGCILPLAYGVIDSENDNSWTWFFEHFRGAFGERVNMCVVSDRHESIIKAVSRVYPSVPHYACVWHLWQNVCKYYKKSKNTLSDVFYAMAKAYRQEDFDEIMKKVEDMDHRVKDYLMLAGYEKWARVHAPANRGRMMTSNIAECINSCLVEARELPIIDFLEPVRILFGDWNCRNREKATYTFTTLGRKFQEMLVVNEAKSSRMTVRPSSESLYGVDDNGRRYIVCLIKYYKPSTLISTYEIPIGPLPDEEDWNIPDSVLNEVVLPPKYKRPPGRPKKSRHKNMSEKISSSTNCCGQCGQEGHNRRTYSYFPMKR
ncbi:hypothetical protein KY285_010491 [Solanum tuberosum]|nr:hypothetical protein KY289_011043 [Solanum tuberosum]KAH0734784.1 hypothetical protein KY285_010491 [Solanum tuberosum]